MIIRGGFNGAKIPDFFRNLEKFSRVSVRTRPIPDPSLEQAVPDLFAILQFERWIWNWNGTNAILHATTLKVLRVSQSIPSKHKQPNEG